MSRRHHHSRFNFGHIINGIDKKVISPIGKQIIKPVWKQATKTINAPVDLASKAINNSGSLSLPILVVGGLALVFLLKR